MRPDPKELLERQATWQRSRAGMSWAEKLRASVRMRRALRGWRVRAKHQKPTTDTSCS